MNFSRTIIWYFGVTQSILISICSHIVWPIVTTKIWSTNDIDTKCFRSIPYVVSIIIGVIGVVEVVVVDTIIIRTHHVDSIVVVWVCSIVSYGIVIWKRQEDTISIIYKNVIKNDAIIRLYFNSCIVCCVSTINYHKSCNIYKISRNFHNISASTTINNCAVFILTSNVNCFIHNNIFIIGSIVNKDRSIFFNPIYTILYIVKMIYLPTRSGWSVIIIYKNSIHLDDFNKIFIWDIVLFGYSYIHNAFCWWQWIEYNVSIRIGIIALIDFIVFPETDIGILYISSSKFFNMNQKGWRSWRQYSRMCNIKAFWCICP